MNKEWLSNCSFIKLCRGKGSQQLVEICVDRMDLCCPSTVVELHSKLDLSVTGTTAPTDNHRYRCSHKEWRVHWVPGGFFHSGPFAKLKCKRVQAQTDEDFRGI